MKNTPYAYDYTGGEQTFTAPCNGYYKLEVWGAQGGTATSRTVVTTIGGYGAYSVGLSNILKNTKLYINVGGQGNFVASALSETIKGNSYNGGGNTSHQYKGVNDKWDFFGAGGGGATHIASSSGLLRNVAVGRLYIVSGGGGGGGSQEQYSSDDIFYGNGGHGGGIKGNDGYTEQSTKGIYSNSTGGTQTSGGLTYTCQYGDTESTTWYTVAEQAGYGHGAIPFSGNKYSGNGGCLRVSGGGGYYGGGAQPHGGGAGGSGYIGSSNLISGGGVTKHMTCYSCTTSSVAATRTYSNTTTPTSTPTADVARIGKLHRRMQMRFGFL